MSQHDFMTEAGATTLARRIRLYWMRKGYEVEVRIVDSHVGDTKGKVWGVRSDLVNGMPTSLKIEGVAA